LLRVLELLELVNVLAVERVEAIEEAVDLAVSLLRERVCDLIGSRVVALFPRLDSPEYVCDRPMEDVPLLLHAKVGRFDGPAKAFRVDHRADFEHSLLR
jgi:hypothetical protein